MPWHEIRRVSIILLGSPWLPILLFASPNIRAASATRPTTAPATVDFSDPKTAYESEILAYLNDNPTAMKSCIFIPTPADEPFVDASVSSAMATHLLAKSAEARFGADAQRLSKYGILTNDLARKLIEAIKTGTVKSGGHGVAFVETADHGLKSFKKTNEGWKIADVNFASDRDRDDWEKQMRAEAPWMREFASRIDQGKFKSIDEVEAAFVRERNRLEQTTPTSAK